MAIPAPLGIVTNQLAKIFRVTVRLIELNPRAIPTPNTEPANVCVVDIGNQMERA